MIFLLEFLLFEISSAEKLWAENDCSTATEISNNLCWVWNGIKDWTINWTFLWFWHYYNWYRMATNVICTCTLRCDRLFLSADYFEVNPVRSIQRDTLFWWVSKLKLKPSSHLHNILHPKTHLVCEHEQKAMGQRDRREKLCWKKKVFFSTDSIDHSLFIPQGPYVWLIMHAHSHCIKQTLQFHPFTFLFSPTYINSNGDKCRKFKNTASSYFPCCHMQV